MRFTLADLKKSFTRRQGETYLTPYLLRPSELADELAALVALFEAHVGRERLYFPDDRPALLLGDYRLGRCLAVCMSEWYEWRSPEWPEGATEAEAAALQARDITSSGALRLALYDYLNEHSGGFLAAAERDTALDRYAATLGVARSTLDDLLRLDAEPQQVLTRLSATAPSVDELRARYNQRAVETLLANAATVDWTLDPQASRVGDEGLGTLVKRVCFLARQMGVQYDIAFETPTASLADEESPLPRVAERRAPYATPVSPQALDAIERPLLLTLYGPQELTGAPNQYGERLARLCRALLGYRRSAEADGRAALDRGGLRGVARVYAHGRPVAFALDERLLRLLRVGGAPATVSAAESGFDSSLERRLHEEFATLAEVDATAGWRLEREPAPILMGETILVPDFALTRGARRIYLEIAGYWRAGYRERKVRKLRAIAGSVAFILAAPEAARAEFASLADAFPILWYTDYLDARALLALMERAYDDFPARLAALDTNRVHAEAQARGRIPPREAYALLGCYTRNELAQALAALDEAGADVRALEWIDGVGLCAADWLEALCGALRACVAASGGRVALADLRRQLQQRDAMLGELSDAAIERLTERTGCTVARMSIFEVLALGPGAAPPEVGATPVAPAARVRVSAQPSRAPRRKKHGVSYGMRSFFAQDAADFASDPADPGPGTPDAPTSG